MRKLKYFLAAGLLGAASGSAHAELSANVGMVSDYIFRSFFQDDFSPFGGLDYENESGFYVGT
jgi:uncharacterized protein (TIGR02001 family)